MTDKVGREALGNGGVRAAIITNSRTLIDKLFETSKEIQEYFHISPEFKEKVLNMIISFPHLPNHFEEMVLYYLKTLEYFELYALDPFDPRLDRVEQKLEALSIRLGLRYEISKNVKLKARQLLGAYG